MLFGTLISHLFGRHFSLDGYVCQHCREEKSTHYFYCIKEYSGRCFRSLETGGSYWEEAGKVNRSYMKTPEQQLENGSSIPIIRSRISSGVFLQELVRIS